MLNRKRLFFGWIVFLLAVIVFFVFKPTLINTLFEYLSQKSMIYLYLLIFILGAVRGFTLIPVTYLIILGLIFIPAVPLYLIIMSGVMISSLCVFYFFEYLRVDKMLEGKYKKQVDFTKYYLSKYEFPVIVFWSFNPFLPSDLICYVAGTLRLNVYKFALGMFLGEGIMCAVYIFGGKFFLNYFFSLAI